MQWVTWFMWHKVTKSIRNRTFWWGVYMLPEIFVFCKANYLTLCSLAWTGFVREKYQYSRPWFQIVQNLTFFETQMVEIYTIRNHTLWGSMHLYGIIIREYPSSPPPMGCWSMIAKFSPVVYIIFFYKSTLWRFEGHYIRGTLRDSCLWN